MIQDSTPIPMTPQEALRIAMLLSGLTRNINLYPPGNPALARPLADLKQTLEKYLALESVLHLGIAKDILFIGEQLLVDIPDTVEGLQERFRQKKIEQVIIEPGLTEDELFNFIQLLNDPKLTGAEMAPLLESHEIRHIRLDVITEYVNETLRRETSQVYQDAVVTMRQIFDDIEQQRIPDSGKIIAVTRHLAAIALQDPCLLVGLAMIKEYDHYTFSHSINVGVLAMALAASIGYDRHAIEETGIAGFLHDIGKTRIAKEIINKPGRLSAAEFAEIKKHPEKGVKILGEMIGISSKVTQAVLGHHIRHSRMGYPEWARQLPFNPISEIIAIADCYDASTTLRAYHHPLSPAQAIQQLQKLAGDYLERGLVEHFVQMMGRYPIGTLVRLDTNEIAVVIKPDPTNNDHPFIKIIIAADGTKIDQPTVIRLGDPTAGASIIVSEVDPVQKGIDVGGYFR